MLKDAMEPYECSMKTDTVKPTGAPIKPSSNPFTT